MQFTCTVDIDQPRDKVTQLFVDTENLKEYQDGFLGKDLLEGEAGHNGAVSKMLYQHGKGRMELIETIIDNSLPGLFLAIYHHKHMDNTMKSQFIALSDTQTRYISEIEYTAFRGFPVKVMAYLIPGIFKKQVQKWLNNFKSFAEKHT